MQKHAKEEKVIMTLTKKWPQLAIVLSFAFVPHLAVAAIDVDLAVNTNLSPPILEIVGNSSKCPDRGLDCIEVAKYSQPNIRFNLEDACDTASSGPEYKLQEIRISMVDKVWPSSAFPLPPDVASDFNADGATGLVDLNAGKNKRTDDRIKFKNKNSKEYTIFFEITAQHCTNAAMPAIKLDPSIRNLGK